MKFTAVTLLAALVVTSATAQTSRSEAGAIASIVSRASTAQANALIKGLNALERKGGSQTDSSWPGAWELLMGTVQGSDLAELTAFKSSAGSFDVESVAILVRDAYFGGIDDDGTSGRTLALFSPEMMMKTGNAPIGAVRVPEEVILMNIKSRLPSGPAETLERVVRSQENASRTEGFKNFGYVNAEKILVAALSNDGKAEFVAAWKGMSYDDREVCLQLIRDAFMGGLNDL